MERRIIPYIHLMRLEKQSMASFIEIKNLKKHFGDHEVLDDISLSIDEGEIVSIIGSSGSGKSTLLRCINLLEEPTSGEIIIDGDNVLRGDISKEKLREKIGMVFQSFNLFDNMNVLKNCMIGPLKVLHMDKEEARKEALKNLALVGMDQYINARPKQLSGGQKQRVAIARALTMHPKCLLFDEPTSALDPEMVGEVLDVIKSLKETGLTLIIVTHEMQFARDVSNRIIFIDEGKVLQDTSTENFFLHQENERIKAFLKRFHQI